jgi:hypothetical protein
MQLPIVAPAPIVTAHVVIFRDLFENRCQFQHFQHYLTGLIVLDSKSLANITRCVLESADKTNLSRFFSEAPWFQDRVNERRVEYLLQQTQAVRSPKDVQRLSRLLIAACLAYIWVVYLGSVCEKEQWRPIIHRRTRCDLSLFQLGLRFLEYLLNEEISIPVQSHVTI